MPNLKTHKVTKKVPAKAAIKISNSKKVNRLTSKAEFRSTITAKGKPLSQIVIESRG